MKQDPTLGYCEGDICGRNRCDGVIAEHAVENCSCHIHPPCGACTEPKGYCPVCGWEEKDDVIFNDHIVNQRHDGTYRLWTPRPLDPSKIDWRSEGHTHFTMKKRGVCPEGTTRAEVESVCKGTFGGRFEYWRPQQGKPTEFCYIAQTD